ncbi:phosphoribosylanthranilate isomerase [Acidithiobacillus ferriphilus]|uniref:phosphoribosylanthranilate isomerase n=1 Tax=Acidithiobacillus ferriphilus TaxID=1689834 RepID=UPI002DB8CA63|nr:phosphoribosylanthranilate isomerase [Acidithiobacillus ferriphilus]MEB8534884.1 phosphoribosylanthranilate isomerase [Acidithiobacillus ferriphilus]
MVRIKICGITNAADARAAAAVGADAIGLVFYRKSPRALDAARTQDVLTALPPFITRVGLFVNADAAEVAATLQQYPLDVLQFHGDESPSFCRSFDRPYIKVVRVTAAQDLRPAVDAYHDAQGLLLDCAVPGVWGGSGQSFDWWRLSDLGKPWILAGGLNAGNVAEAIAIARPYAVDVSSGVEMSPGRKDHDKMAQFVARVRGA